MCQYSIRHAALAVFQCLLTALLLTQAGLLYAQPALEPIGSNLNEQVVRIPIVFNEPTELETTIFRPPGPGPFPVLLINHGKAEGNPRQQPRARYYTVAREFVRRGYVVILPMRKGFAGSGGMYMSAGCNLYANSQFQAADISAVIDWIKQQPYADISKLMVFGQSYGGLATLALIGNEELPIKLAVNFAGGLKITASSRPCDWETALISAVGQLGRISRAPSLWFYGENDSYFGPELSERMYEAYRVNGGDAKIVHYADFKQNAHKMFGDPDGWSIWLPPTLKMMKQVGLPTDVKFVSGTQPSPPSSGYAPIDTPDRLPFVEDSGKTAYQHFLERYPPRAFAVSSSGAWGWASDGDESMSEALKNCQKHSKSPCRLYAVDEEVVWQYVGGNE